MSHPTGGKFLNLVEVAAELVKHFGLKPWEIEQLDRWWIAHVYFHPRDKWGDLKVSNKDSDEKLLTQWQQFAAWCRSWDWPEWMIEARWRAMIARRDAPKGSSRNERAKSNRRSRN